MLYKYPHSDSGGLLLAESAQKRGGKAGTGAAHYVNYGVFTCHQTHLGSPGAAGTKARILSHVVEVLWRTKSFCVIVFFFASKFSVVGRFCCNCRVTKHKKDTKSFFFFFLC